MHEIRNNSDKGKEIVPSESNQSPDMMRLLLEEHTIEENSRIGGNSDILAEIKEGVLANRQGGGRVNFGMARLRDTGMKSRLREDPDPDGGGGGDCDGENGIWV
jgi:hypothetical protein